MNTPFPFNLTLASEPIKWPLITRDGRKARIVCTDRRGNQPIVALLHGDTWEETHHFNADGIWTEAGKSGHDLLLSADLTDQSVRDAVQRCHEAVVEIWQKMHNGDTWWKPIGVPAWRWNVSDYLPACLVPDAKPEPQIAKGHNPDAPEKESDYAALEREHLGDPEKGTGIYWKPSPAQPVFPPYREKPACVNAFTVCGFTHGKAVSL